MTIAITDVKIMQSQVMLDTSDGGGAVTSNEVIDGASNNIFPDISDLDRTYGVADLRKIFAFINTANTDTYYGANFMVCLPPNDPNVSVTLFTTKDWFDRRADAENYLETYLAKGTKLNGQLLGTQVAGAKAFTQLMLPTDIPPSVGDTVVLVQDEGLSTEFDQFVKITAVTSTLRTFTIGSVSNSTKFTGQVVTCTITEPLQYTFLGPEPTIFDDATARAFTRATLVADAAKFYGIAPLAVAGAINDLTVKVETIFSQLIPNTTAEVAISNQSLSKVQTPIQSGPVETIATTGMSAWTTGTPWYAGVPLMPGTCILQGGGSYTYTDDGQGNILNSSALVVGAIDYANGLITTNGSASGSWPVAGTSFKAAPAAFVSQDTTSQATLVTQSNQGTVQSLRLPIIPAPGTLVISYRYQNKNYDLVDVGGGVLSGGSAGGGGTINYATGDVVATLAALPDIGSFITYAYGYPVNYQQNAGDVNTPVPAIVYTVNGGSIQPGSLTISWVDGGGTTRTITDDVGRLDGYGTGAVIYNTGYIVFRPTVLAPYVTGYTVTYHTSAVHNETYTPSPSGASVTINAAVTPITPGTVKLSFTLPFDILAGGETPTGYTGPSNFELVLRDDGLGNLYDINHFDGMTYNGFVVYQGLFGTVNYSTGQIIFNSSMTFNVSTPVYTTYQYPNFYYPSGTNTNPVQINVPYNVITSYTNTSVTIPFTAGSVVTLSYTDTAASTAPQTETAPSPPISLNLIPRSPNPLVRNSLQFKIGSDTYVDRNGTLYRAISNVDNSGTVAGTINYNTHVATITSWTGNVTPTISVLSALTELGNYPITNLAFATSSAPIRPESFSFSALRLSDNATITGTTDGDGNIVPGSGSKVSGTVTTVTGAVNLSFGESLLDSSLTTDQKSQPWYNSANVDSTGHIWHPIPIVPGSLTYDAVADSFLPLDPTILGLDPVRLPSDGRVPIFNLADVLVVHNTQSILISGGGTVGQTINCGRVRCAYIRIIDSLGVPMATSMYTTNLSAGTITLGSTYSTAGLTLPVYVEHRVEDQVLCSGSDISGLLNISRPLSHAYPIDPGAGGPSYVSSTLVLNAAGMQSRAYNLFVQQTWSGVWADSPVGSPISANYNSITYPIIVTNQGTIQERWALVFVSSTTFNIVGEKTGQITSTPLSINDVSGFIAIPNPNFGGTVYYFKMMTAGFGSGWAAGNAIRFNTQAANYPVWCVRTVLQSTPSGAPYNFRLNVRGSVTAS